MSSFFFFAGSCLGLIKGGTLPCNLGEAVVGLGMDVFLAVFSWLVKCLFMSMPLQNVFVVETTHKQKSGC